MKKILLKNRLRTSLNVKYFLKENGLRLKDDNMISYENHIQSNHLAVATLKMAQFTNQSK